MTRMINRRKTYRKKRGGKLARVNKYASTTRNVASAAYTALKLASYTARMINTEVKYYDTTISSTVTSTGTVYTGLATIAQGDGATNRDGSSIKPMRLTVNMNIQMVAADVTSLVRVIFFRGKTEDGTNPVISDILQTTAVNAHKTWTKRFNSKIIYDQVFAFSSSGTQNINRKFSIKLDGHINYAASSNIPESGGVWGIAVTNTASATPIAFITRLTFTDN